MSVSSIAAASPPKTFWFGPTHIESTAKPIHLRKFARLLLGKGEVHKDQEPIWLGPIGARLEWRSGWRWNEYGLDTRLPQGLRGGPIMILELPLHSSHPVFALQTQIRSLRYVYVSSSRQHHMGEELFNPHSRSQSFEVGICLSFALSRAREAHPRID
jgi:hypothetical protein